MNRLLAIELQKIGKNRASKILIIAYFVLLSFIALIASIKFDLGFFHIDPSENGIFNFPFVWHFNSYVADYFSFFLAIIIVSMTANEYSYGTLKQNLIDGMSKKEFILSKFLTIVLLSFCSTIFVFIMSLILGFIFSKNTQFLVIFSEMSYLVAFFVKLVGFFSFCLFLGILVKRSAFALGFLFVWYIFEGIFHGITFWLLDYNSEIANKVIAFLPLQSMSNLLIEPYTKLDIIKNIGSMVGLSQNKDYGVHFSSLLIVLVWSFIFVFLSYRLLKKRDL
jgi:ABC-type transport system involved in multi-copper enzyme maturation permease subunit